MNTQTMITNITNSIQTESNLILLLTAAIKNKLSTMSDDQLAMICQILGVPTQ